MVARGSGVRDNMMRILEKANAEMGRMVLDLHRLKREKLDYITSRKEGGTPRPSVKRCLLTDLKDPTSDEPLGKSRTYQMDFEKMETAATMMYLDDIFPEKDSSKHLYDYLAVSIQEGGDEMVYGRNQLEKLLQQPAVDCMESFLLADGFADKTGADMCQQIKKNLSVMVKVERCPVWTYVSRAPVLPWPWTELAKRDDLTLAIYDKLKVYLLQEKAALSSNKSADIWQILRADRDAHKDQSAWKSPWDWKVLAKNQYIRADDYSTFYDELKIHRKEIDVNGSEFLDIVIVDLKKNPANAQVWDWKDILSHKKLNMTCWQAIKARKTDEPSTEARDMLSKNKGRGIWELVAHDKTLKDWLVSEKRKGKAKVGAQVVGWDWDWKELSCNPFLDISLFRLYKNNLDFGRLSSNGTTHIWDIVDEDPNEQWVWEKLSSNKHITLGNFSEYKNVIDIDKLSENSGENVPTIFVKHPELPWTLDKLCKNEHVSLAIVLKTRDKLWKLPVLAENGVIPAPFFRKADSWNEQEQQKLIDSYLERRAVISTSPGETMREAQKDDRSESFRILSILLRENCMSFIDVNAEDRSASFIVLEGASASKKSRSQLQKGKTRSNAPEIGTPSPESARNESDDTVNDAQGAAKDNGSIGLSPAQQPWTPAQNASPERALSLPSQHGPSPALLSSNDAVSNAQDFSTRGSASPEQSHVNSTGSSPLVVASGESDVVSQPAGVGSDITTPTSGDKQESQQSHTDGVERADALSVTSSESPSSQSHENEGEGGGTGSFPLVVASHAGESNVTSPPAENEREPSTPSMNNGDSDPLSGDLQEPEQNHANGVVGDDDDSSDSSDVSSQVTSDSPISERLQEEAQSGHRGSVGELTDAFGSLDFRTKHERQEDRRDGEG